MAGSLTSWSTKNEIDWITGAITGRWTQRPLAIDRDEFLEGCIRHARRRMTVGTYGTVDGKAVIEHCEKLLGE